LDLQRPVFVTAKLAAFRDEVDWGTGTRNTLKDRMLPPEETLHRTPTKDCEFRKVH
jgi:hypothetical protein